MNLKEIDAILVKNSIVKSNFSILNQTNKEEEFEKFLLDKTYNPQFTYKSFDASQYIQELESLDIPQETKLGKLFHAIRNVLLIEAKGLHHVGTQEYDTMDLFSKVPTYVLEEAYDILKREVNDEEEEETVSAQELGKVMRAELDSYGCDEWNIVFSEDAAARMSVSAAKKIVTIKEGEKFSDSDVIKLVAHEISAHVLRALNGALQPYEIFSIGTPQYLTTEEGLAGYNERVQGINKQSTLKYYALSALNTHLARHHGFVEIYNKVRKYYDDDWGCFKAIARVKRGVGDSSLPGGYLKDHCYLEGLLVIEKFVKEGKDIKDLYVGKIAIDDLDLVKEGILLPAKVIPHFLK